MRPPQCIGEKDLCCPSVHSELHVRLQFLFFPNPLFNFADPDVALFYLSGGDVFSDFVTCGQNICQDASE